MSNPEQTCMPTCMMPDGAEPCEGYTALLAKVEELEDRLAAVKSCPIHYHGGVMQMDASGLFPTEGMMKAIDVLKAIKEQL